MPPRRYPTARRLSNPEHPRRRARRPVHLHHRIRSTPNRVTVIPALRAVQRRETDAPAIRLRRRLRCPYVGGGVPMRVAALRGRRGGGPEPVGDQVEDTCGSCLTAAGRVDVPPNVELKQNVIRVDPGLAGAPDRGAP